MRQRQLRQLVFHVCSMPQRNAQQFDPLLNWRQLVVTPPDDGVLILGPCSCVQETQALLMSTLPVDQPFRYDGPVGSNGREAGFLLHSSIVATPMEPLTHSLFAGVSSRALFVSAHFMRHMLALPLTHASSSGAHLQPQSIVSRSSTQASRCFSRGTLTFGSDLSSSVVHDRLMHFFYLLQEILQSHSLVFRNPLISLLTVVVLLWTSFSQHLLSQAASLSTLVPIAVHSRLSVAPAFFRPHVVTLSS